MTTIPYVHVYNGSDLLFTLRASSVRWGLAGKLMVFYLLDDEICCFDSHRADRLMIEFVLNGEIFRTEFTEKDFDVISDPQFDFCDFIGSKFAV